MMRFRVQRFRGSNISQVTGVEISYSIDSYQLRISQSAAIP